MFLDFPAITEYSNKVVRTGFDFLVSILKIVVDALKHIPTGFGVDLYHFLIACIITGVVVTGIVNVVKTSSFNSYSTISERRAIVRKNNDMAKKGHDFLNGG